MDVENITSWVSQPDVCRCCLSASGSWDLTASYISEAGRKELSYLSEWGPSRLVCGLCVDHLREAEAFKKQVLQAEKHFTEYYDSKKVNISEIPIKSEPELEDHSPEGFAEQFQVSHTENQSPEPETKPRGKLKLNKALKRKRHKHLKAKGVRETADSEGDSDTPISELTKKSEMAIVNDIDNYNDNIELNKATLEISKTDLRTIWRTPRVTPESYIENRNLRANITLILKNSTVVPFRHINKYKYTCLYCDSSYLFFKQLKTHIFDKHNKLTEKEISASLKTPKNLIKAEVSEIKCKLCTAEFKTIDNLVQHLVLNHKKVYHTTPELKPSHGILGFDLTSEKFKCHVCEKEFRFFKNLSVHMNEHGANFVCHYCGKKFLSDHRLHAHVKMHKETDLKCKLCDKVFRTTSARAYHVRKVHSKAAYACPECDEVFLHYQKRLQHLVSAHNLKKPEYKCDICSKNYASSGGLSAHVQYSHLKTKEYPCQICGKNFGYKWTLKKHLVVHTGAKNFECKFCSKKFAEMYTLKVHLRIHLNDKPFGCEVCETAFVQKCSLKNHIRVHHADSGIDLNKL